MNVFEIASLNKLHAFKTRWNALYNSANTSSPFSSFDYMTCYYRAYGDSLSCLITTDGEVQCVFPGTIAPIKKGFNLKAFYTPPLDMNIPVDSLICENHSKSLLKKNIEYIFQNLSADVVIFHQLKNNSPLADIIQNHSLPKTAVYLDHSAKHYGMFMPDGYDNFWAERSLKFRRKAANAINRATRTGSIELAIYKNGEEDFSTGVARMKALDLQTWQHTSHSGAFAHHNDEDFYANIGKTLSENLNYFIFVLSLGGKDCAFLTAVTKDNYAFYIKQGYTPEQASASPGFICMARATEYLAQHGTTFIDQGTTLTEEKKRWSNTETDYHTFWLLNLKSLNGLTLYLMLAVWKIRKKILSNIKNNK